ncbi:MAG: hypothetical protein ACW98F_02515 [Candidatus Hodarchaeales archaeon]|jgi:hypothetical protein
MKLTEKIIDSTTGLKMKSGAIVEVHVIHSQNSDERSLMIKTDNGVLSLDQEDISSFMDLFSKFLESF